MPATDIPAHDALFAGFPRLPLSVIGDSLGFEDTRGGSCFWRSPGSSKPRNPAFLILENVKQLRSPQKGETSRVISANPGGVRLPGPVAGVERLGFWLASGLSQLF
ncbi:MAG: DNA cytosine methyltransferase [Deltaproteobacteria bacterium]|nr:DNA cytosine methyltransferase [Deltaproteobacteria bacterium]